MTGENRSSDTVEASFGYIRFDEDQKYLKEDIPVNKVSSIFGQVVQIISYQDFDRAVKETRAEFNLACSARNLRKIWLYLQKKEGDGEKSLSSKFPIVIFRDLSVLLRNPFIAQSIAG